MTRLTLLLPLLFSILLYGQSTQKTQVAILGTVHQKTANFDENTVYNILSKFKPDFILLEADSSSFTKEFDLIKVYPTNEFIGANKYKQRNPRVELRPFEFENKKSYREDTLGITSGIGVVFNEIIRLKDLDSLNVSQKAKWIQFEELSKLTDSISQSSSKSLNNSITQNIVRERQFYQYYKMGEIVNSERQFLDLKTDSKNNQGKITLREYYKRYSNFELLRNYQISQNILGIIKQNPNKKIIVLVGYFHKPAILDILKWEQRKLGYEIIEPTE